MKCNHCTKEFEPFLGIPPLFGLCFSCGLDLAIRVASPTLEFISQVRKFFDD